MDIGSFVNVEIAKNICSLIYNGRFVSFEIKTPRKIKIIFYAEREIHDKNVKDILEICSNGKIIYKTDDYGLIEPVEIDTSLLVEYLEFEGFVFSKIKATC